MALKMMSFNSVDEQFIADNMLTDEDFIFDTGEEFEISYEDQNVMQMFASDLQVNNDTLSVSNQTVIHKADACPDLNDLLQDYMFNLEFKSEPHSPSSSDVSNDNEVSIINIPDISTNNEAANVLADTPPHTPHGAIDFLPDSPVSCNVEPMIVPVNSVNGITYTVPQSTLAVLSPNKYHMNIKPKVDQGAKAIAPKAGNTGLTPEQMERLAKGALKLRPPPNIVSTSKEMNSLFAKTLKNSSTKKNSQLSGLEVCTAALKRQERILRNRESAYQSRIRKKEYVQKLEAELNNVSAENFSLREENCRLKTKISDLEKEIQKLRDTFSPKNVKKTIGLMVVICMLTLNLAPYSSFFEKTALKPLKSNVMDHRIGRVLLWNDGNNTDESKESTKVIPRKFSHIQREIKSSYIVNFDQSLNSSTCQHFINKTESLRLENDLLGWVERVEKKQKQSKMKKRKFHMDTTLPHLAAWSKRRAEINKDIWAKRKNKNEILIYETPRKVYEDFFDAIHRRDDTFYFVSFSGDHLLLPAIAHNKTLRPRMSFVMPAMTLNESVGESDEHVSMMQIDCEVMDTKLVYIKESVIPEHLRQRSNATKSHSKSTGDRHTKRIQLGSRLLQKSHPDE